jgi:hypothetical protein
LVPASDGADDFVRISGPSEGLRLDIVFDDEAIDGGLQIDDRDEDNALQSPLGEFCEEAIARYRSLTWPSGA